MADKKPYEGKAEMLDVPALRELMREMMNIPVFDPAVNKVRDALHRLLEQKEQTQ